jgi:lysophospholipid acyltransferase (LPLAT)-like uncharacterized protein
MLKQPACQRESGDGIAAPRSIGASSRARRRTCRDQRFRFGSDGEIRYDTGAMTSWKTWYRVDAVPRRWWPLYVPLSYALAALVWVYVRCVRATCRIDWEGRAHLATPRFLWVLWHEHVWLGWVTFGDWRGQGWMNHPYWYMRPIHLAATWDGLETLYLGSSGAGGREALQRLVEGVRRGENTMILPDGPNGPRRQLRPGAVALAAATGVPLVPIRFDAVRCLRLRGWDGKSLPLPLLSRWKVTVGEPFVVPAGSEAAATERLREALG